MNLRKEIRKVIRESIDFPVNPLYVLFQKKKRELNKILKKTNQINMSGKTYSSEREIRSAVDKIVTDEDKKIDPEIWDRLYLYATKKYETGWEK